MHNTLLIEVDNCVIQSAKLFSRDAWRMMYIEILSLLRCDKVDLVLLYSGGRDLVCIRTAWTSY